MKAPRIVVVVNGGLVTDILCDRPAEAVRIDYDTEGFHTRKLTPVPQGDGTTDESCACGFEVEVNQQRVEELFNAVNPRKHQEVSK